MLKRLILWRPAVLRSGWTLVFYACAALSGLGTAPGAAQVEPALGVRRILGLRVSFPPESPDDETTSGDGSFDLRPFSEASTEYRFAFDTPPHDRTYFEAHLEALANYYAEVSTGQLTLEFEVYPRDNDAGYLLDQALIDFGNGRTRTEIEERITRLFRDAIIVADAKDSEIDFSRFDHVIVFHAGLGGESTNALNDVPSAFINENDLVTYAGGAISVDGVLVRSGSLLPEAGSSEGRGGLNGLLARFYANQLGLPRLDNPEDGLPAVGDWSLMDTGNITVASSRPLGLDNLSGESSDTILVGFVPSRMLAWSRAALGWIDIPTVAHSDTVTIAAPHVNDGTPQAVRIPINGEEYFLLENRISRLAVEARTPTITIGERGVWTDNDDYDAFIPGSGILIWHVDDAVISSSGAGRPVNSHPDFRVHFNGFAGLYRKGIALEEADGLDDIGNASSSRVISGGIISFGKIAGNTDDPYYIGNVTRFGPDTVPSTESNLGYATGIEIEALSPPGDLMNVAVRFTRQSGAWPVTDAAPSAAPRSVATPKGTQILRSTPTGLTTLTMDGQPGSIQIAAFFAPAVGNVDGAPGDEFIFDGPDGPSFWQDGTVKTLVGGPLSAPPILARFPEAITDIWPHADGSIEWGRFTGLRGSATLPASSAVGVAADSRGLVALGANNTLYRVDPDGSSHELSLFTTPHRGPVVADLDADGNDEVLLVADDGAVVHLGDGTDRQRGRSVDGGATSEPVLADFDGDGFVEALFGGVDRIWVVRFNGVLQAETPFALPIKDRVGAIEGPPVIADVDADDRLDVLFGSRLGLVYAVDRFGRPVPGFPLAAVGPIDTSPLLDDLDNDGDLELVVFTSNGASHLWHLDSVDPELSGTTVAWGQLGGNAGNTALLRQAAVPVDVPADVGLMPNGRVYCYPNPIRTSEAFLRFYLTEAAEVSVTIINPQGEVVDRLTAGHTDALTDNEIRWDTSEYASGFYICRVEAIAAGRSEVRFVKAAIIR